MKLKLLAVQLKEYSMIKTFLILILIFTLAFNFASSEVMRVDKNRLESIIKKNKGEIIFINVWATWCKPCVEEFPDLVKLHEKYNKAIRFLSLSVDFGKNPEEQIKKFLKEQDAKFDVYLIEERSSEDIINYLNKDWSGAVPATFIYDKKGEQKAFLLGLHKYEDFENELNKIMNDNPK